MTAKSGSDVRLRASIAVVALVICTLAVFYWRLFFGVDFTDEAFYVALPYSAVLGHRPFIDELKIFQTAGLFLIPWIHLYHWLTGTSDGLILFARHLYLMTSIAVAAIVAWSFHRRQGWIYSAGVASVLVAFVPFSIPGLCYNTLGSLFWTAGVLLSTSGMIERGGSARGALPGALCCAVAVIAYPTLLIPVLVWLIVACLTGSAATRRYRLGWTAALSTLGAITIAWLLLGPGWANLRAIYLLNTGLGIHGGGIDKVTGLLVEFFKSLPAVKLLIPALGVMLAWRFFSPSKRIPWEWTVFVVPAASLIEYYDKPFLPLSCFFIIFYAVLGLPILFQLRDEPYWRKSFWLVGVPSLIAGITTGWTSSNGFMNACLGILPLVPLILLAAHERFKERGRPYLTVLALAALLAPLLYSLVTFIYRDGPISAMTTTVRTGPYLGIRTTPRKLEFIEQFEKDMAVASVGKKTIFVYDNFPAGYLFALRPMTNTLWTNPLNYASYDRGGLIQYYSDPLHQPDVVFEMYSFPVQSGYEMRFSSPNGDGFPYDPFHGFFKNRPGYTLLLERPEYRIFVMQPPHDRN